MSERPTTETPRATSPEIVGNGPFTIADMDTLRDKQLDVYVDQVIMAPVHSDITTMREQTLESFKEMNNKSLSEKGITEDHPQREAYETLLADYSLGVVPANRWELGVEDDNGIRAEGARESFRSELQELKANEPKAANGEDSAESTLVRPTLRAEIPALIEAREKDPALRGAIEKLNTLRNDLAGLTAQRLGKPVSFDSKYDEARAAYNKALVNAGKLEEGVLNAAKNDRSDDEKNADVIHYLLNEQTKLRDATRELFANTKASKIVEWFNSGSKLQRVGKGVLASLPAGILAVVAAPAGIAIGAATAGIMASRFTRNYARHDKERGMRTTEESIDEFALRELQEKLAASFEAAVKYLDEAFDADKKEEQKKRRKAVAWGVGGIALGTTVGAAIDLAGDIDVKARWPFGGDEAETTPSQKDPSTGGGREPIDKPGDDTEIDKPGGDTIDKPDKPGTETVANKDLTRDQLFDGTRGSTEFTDTGLKDFNKWVEGHRVTRGESIWSLSEQYLQQEGIANPSIEQIDAVKDRVVPEFRAHGLADRRGWLNKGDIIKSK